MLYNVLGIKCGQTNLETTLALTLMDVRYWNINSRDYTIGCVILECVVGLRLLYHWDNQVVIKRHQPTWNYFANTSAVFLLVLLGVLPCEPKDFFHESQKNIVGSMCWVQSILEPVPTAYSRVLLRLVVSVSVSEVSISASASARTGL